MNRITRWWWYKSFHFFYSHDATELLSTTITDRKSWRRAEFSLFCMCVYFVGKGLYNNIHGYLKPRWQKTAAKGWSKSKREKYNAEKIQGEHWYSILHRLDFASQRTEWRRQRDSATPYYFMSLSSWKPEREWANSNFKTYVALSR